MVERKLDGSYLLTLYREWIKSIRKKSEFLKNISKNNMKMKKIFNFSKIEFWLKKGPCRTPHSQKKKIIMKNIGKGDIKKGPAKGTDEKMVMDGLSL